LRIASQALLITDASLPAARAAGDAFFGRDRHQRWNLYTRLAPTTDISEVLDEIDRDPTHISGANPWRSAVTAAIFDSRCVSREKGILPRPPTLQSRG